MDRLIRILSVICILVIGTSNAIAQRTITGKIQDAHSNEAIIGANILCDGHLNLGTVSDIDGSFSLEVPIGVVSLTISYTGFETKTVNVENVDEINVLLSSGQFLDEIVVTGYTTQRKKDITGAITIVSAEAMNDVSTPNVISKLQSKVPGLSFTSSGVPGGNDAQISIRGLTSVFGGTGPLWVIDGVQTTNPAGLNPNDIESIQVLKDAASAGIYGTEAARGVIIVTTKQARKGSSGFTLDSRITQNVIRENFKVLGGQEWLDVRYVAQGKTPVSAGNFLYTPETPLPKYLDDKNNLLLSNTNWVNVIMRNSLSTTTDLGYSMAKNNWKLFTGAGYASDNGIMDYTYYKRANLRLNASIKLLNEKLTIGENLTISDFSEVRANATEDALLQNPLIPVYGEDGSFGGPTGAGLQDKWNPRAILFINRNNKQKTLRTFGNVYADYALSKKITLSSKYNFDFNNYKFDEQTESFNQNGSTLGNIVLNNGNAFSRFNSNRRNSTVNIWTNLLSYNNEIGNHSLSGFLGQEIYTKDQVNDYTRIEVPQGTIVDFNNLDSYTILANNSVLDAYGIGADSRRNSLFGKISYDYGDRYYLATSLRRDGSSRFGRNNRYAVFPTFSLGWTVSNEKFLARNKQIDDLKFRLSWGANGNADIAEYAQYSIFNSALENSNYDLNGGGQGPIHQGVSANQVGNPDLKWEQSYQTNIGMDVNLFNYRVNFGLDVYKKNTTDLLLQIIQPSVLGEAGKTLFFNAGDMSNKGLDLVMGYNANSTSKFNYSFNFIFSTYDNKVTKLNNADNFILEGVSYTGVGYPIGSYFGYIADGIFRTPEEVAVHANQTGKALGNIRYRDLNGDGNINQKDRTIIGNPHPDFIYGLNLSMNYSNWDFNLFFDGRQGNDMYNSQRELLDFPYFGFNHGLNTLEAWSPDNANSLTPKLSNTDENDQRRPSTYFIEDGSYFRLKTVSLAYNLKKKSLARVGMESARIYFQLENPINITSFSGFDYEVPGLSRTGIGIAGLATYPHTKTYSLGVNLKF